jgi:hypothetical protein
MFEVLLVVTMKILTCSEDGGLYRMDYAMLAYVMVFRMMPGIVFSVPIV